MCNCDKDFFEKIDQRWTSATYGVFNLRLYEVGRQPMEI